MATIAVTDDFSAAAYSGSGGSPTRPTTPLHGAEPNSLLLNPAASAEWVQYAVFGSSPSRVVAGFWFQVESRPSGSSGQVAKIDANTGSPHGECVLKMSTSGELFLQAYAGTISMATAYSGFSPSLNTWYWLEIMLDKAANPWVWRLRANSTTTETSQATAAGTCGSDQVLLGENNSATYTFHYSYLNYGTASSSSDWMGEQSASGGGGGGGSGVITVRGPYGDRTSSGTSITVDKHSLVVEGDTMYAIVVANVSAAAGNSVSRPDGTWTEIAYLSATGGGTEILGVWMKTAGPSEPTTYTFTQTIADYWLTTFFSVSPEALQPAYNASIVEDVLGPTLTSPSITTENDDDLVFSVFAQDQTGSAGAFAPSSPGGLTELWERWEGDVFLGVAVYQEDRAAAGAGTHVVTQNTGGDNTRAGVAAIWAVSAIGTSSGGGGGGSSGPINLLTLGCG